MLTSRRGDGGFAMVTVALLSMVMVVGSALVIIRAMNTSSHSVNDRNWERAFHVAEAGVDDFVYEISRGGGFHEVDEDTPLETKSDILAAADEIIGTVPEALMPAPEGQALTFKAEGEETVYSVGYTPGYWDPNRKVRVVVTQYDVVERPPTITNWTAEYALLSGGDIEVSGSAVISGAGANVHANGSLDADWTVIEGCGEESTDSGYDAGPHCPESPRPPIAVPLINPLKAYHLSWFDMCPDGLAHYGPAHPNTAKANTTGVPCEGPVVTTTDGGNQGMTPTGSGWANSAKTTPPGVYFVVGDFDGKVGFSGNRQEVTIIAAAYDYVLDCSSTGGTIWLSAQSSAVGHPSAGGLTLVAGGDIVFRGGAEVDGLIMAHEQVDLRGNSTVNGAIIAEDGCDSPGGVHVSTSDISGNAEIAWVGPVGTPFDAVPPEEAGPLDVIVLSQREI